MHWKNWCWSSNTLATCSKEPTHWKRPWCWERLKAGGEGDGRGWDGWMATLTQWTWVWANCGRYCRTGRPGMLQPMGSQEVGHDWATEQQIFAVNGAWSFFKKIFLVLLFEFYGVRFYVHNPLVSIFYCDKIDINITQSLTLLNLKCVFILYNIWAAQNLYIYIHLSRTELIFLPVQTVIILCHLYSVTESSLYRAFQFLKPIGLCSLQGSTWAAFWHWEISLTCIFSVLYFSFVKWG